jgi:hypothetical protein
MFIINSGKKPTDPSGAEGSSKDDTLPTQVPNPTNINEFPSERAALLQERFWGGVDKTNYVN